MRSLLMAMMRQANKVEHFKKSRSRLDALHAKYSISEFSKIFPLIYLTIFSFIFLSFCELLE